MNLFIDANIFLDFYHLSGGDIEELKKLVALVENRDIVLFSSPQLREEVKRNRDAKISDAMRDFTKANFKLSFPAFCKHYNEYEELRAHIKNANKKHAELVQKAMGDVKGRCLAADVLIDDLLGKSQEIEPRRELFDAAVKRFRLGNPPGKKKVTLGDEINWESLLAGVPDKEDLMFISGDGDFCSPIDGDTLNAFLIAEWVDKKTSDIHFYKSLSDFLKDKFPQIRLASDVKTASLVEQLAQSGSFATTHALIASLSKVTDFPAHQIEELVSIAELNNQVGWIIDDDDVMKFYKGILEKYGDAMNHASKEKLVAMLTQEEAPPDPMPENIPF